VASGNITCTSLHAKATQSAYVGVEGYEREYSGVEYRHEKATKLCTKHMPPQVNQLVLLSGISVWVWMVGIFLDMFACVADHVFDSGLLFLGLCILSK
jgi:hypothetical protein